MAPINAGLGPTAPIMSYVLGFPVSIFHLLASIVSSYVVVNLPTPFISTFQLL